MPHQLRPLVPLFALLLLALPVREASAQGEDGIIAAQVGSGVGLIVGGAVVVPITVEAGIQEGGSLSLAMATLNAPLLIAAGVPTLITGLDHLSAVGRAPAGLRRPWLEDHFARVVVPFYAGLGAGFGTLGLGVLAQLSGTSEPVAGPAILMAAGYTLLGSSVPISLSGDAAAAQLPADWRWGKAWLGLSVPLITTGGVALIVVAPILRVIQGDNSDPEPAMPAMLASGGIMLGAGVATLVAGVARTAKLRTSSVTPKRSKFQVHTLAPWADSEQGIYGVAVGGRF